MTCPCKIPNGNTGYCVRRECELATHFMQLCQEVEEYKKHFDDRYGKFASVESQQKGPSLKYKTNDERLALLAEFIETVCKATKCKCFEGFNGCESCGECCPSLEPVYTCTCTGCNKAGRTDITRMNYCPKNKWTMIEKRE